jgi:spermidine synthase
MSNAKRKAVPTYVFSGLASSITLFFCLIFLPLPGLALEPTEKLLFEKNSLYQYIAVVENTKKKERYIYNTKKSYMQGGIYVEAPDKLLFEYTRMSFVSLAFMDRAPEDALFVGLGAGAMPRYFNRHYPDANIDVVEIDPDIFEVARKYFHFAENERCKVHVLDGRMFVKRTPKKYDMIFLDAYQNDYIPFHLTTVEFLREVRKKLNDDGVVVANVTSPFMNKLFYSMIKTYKKVFPHLYLFKGVRSSNYIFVATAGEKRKKSRAVTERAREVRKSRGFDIDLARISLRLSYYTEYEWKSDVLTDDFAPVNLYKHMKAE